MSSLSAPSTQAGASPTISIFLPGYSPLPTSILISEVIPASSGSDITYQLACGDDVEFTDCPFGTNFLLVEGPTSVTWSTDGDDGQTTVQCSFMDSGRASASCTTVTASTSATSTFSTNMVTAVTWQKAAVVDQPYNSLTGSLASLTNPSAGAQATASESGKKSSAGASGSASGGATSGRSGAAATSSTHSAAAPGAMSTGAVAIGGAMAALALAAAAL